MRIAILTFHRAYNCGAMLQAWALQTVLENRGHEVVFPDCNDVGEWCKLSFYGTNGIYRRIRRLAGWLKLVYYYRGLPLLCKHAFAKFMDRNIKHRRLSGREWSKLDLVVVGSDQVWNRFCAGEKNAPIFLGVGIPDSVLMVGYAISVGDKALEAADIDRLRKAGKLRFHKLSWREGALRDVLGLQGPVVCDPTLLLDEKDYGRIELPSRLVKGRYLFVYAVSDAKEVVPAARRVAQAMGLECVVADVYRTDYMRTRDQNIWALTPDRFLAYMRDADAVIVSSFHGCVFSVLYGKRFVCLSGTETKANDADGRQQNLLRGIGLIDRRMPANSNTMDIVAKLNSEYSVNHYLDDLRNSSYNYINEMLSVI